MNTQVGLTSRHPPKCSSEGRKDLRGTKENRGDRPNTVPSAPDAPKPVDLSPAGALAVALEHGPDVQELLIQGLLRGGITPGELLERHGVHQKAPVNGKVTFVYDQIAARDSDPVAQECRGLVLRDRTWDIVAFPFRRFFNHGQGAAADISWGTAAFQEKLDGTLIIAYWDEGRWQCATRSCSEAQGVGPFGYSFAELADRTARDMQYADLDGLLYRAPRNHTLMLELTAPENQIVCAYPTRRLTLLGARDLSTLQEVDPKPIAESLGIPSPREWRFDNIDHLVEVIASWDPRHFEGVVACDRNFNRVKVKSPKYVAVHHASDGLSASWRNVFELVSRGHADDIEPLLPEYLRGRIETARAALGDLFTQAERDWEELRGIDDIKAFAEQAKITRWPAVLFALKRGKTASVVEFAKGTQPQSLIDLCGIRESEAAQ